MAFGADANRDPFVHLDTASARLASRLGSGVLAAEVKPTVRAIARRLAGLPPGDPGMLGTMLLAVADTELAWLASICGGDLVRAGTAAVEWLEQVLRHYEEPRRAAHARVDQSRDVHDSGVFRQQLSRLLMRRVPPEFPLPPAAVSVHAAGNHEATELGVGAALRRCLDIEDATDRASAAALACNELMMTLGTLLPGFGWDFGAGHLQRTLVSRFDRLTALLQRLPGLRRIADELGGLESSARAHRRMDAGGHDCVVGVRLGAEISEVLPCELALLSGPETEDLFYQRHCEHRLFCLELQGAMRETAKSDSCRGPVIACVDTSGSMRGPPEWVAKALILAIVRRVVPEGRPVHLLLFGGPGDAAELVIRRGQSGVDALVEFLSLGFTSGTDYDTPLVRAMKLLQTPEFEKADVLVVTDGLCRASVRIVDDVRAAKLRAGARVVSAVIGCDVSGVEAFSDHVWRLNADAPIEGGLDLGRFSSRRSDPHGVALGTTPAVSPGT